MPLEIERKFLVSKNWKEKAKITGSSYYRQGYLGRNPATVRVRITDSDAYLTIKGKSDNISRHEFEYGIPREDAEQLLLMCDQLVVEKVRYDVEYKGKTWEVDEFKKDNEGLLLAEIELEHEDEPFDIPEWIDEEVTYDKRYTNSNLSKNPYKNWQD